MRRGFLTLLSGNVAGKVVGVFRELLLAALFGTSPAVSALRVATTGTLVPINLLTADALSIGFLPNHAALKDTDPRRAVVFYRAVQWIVVVLGVLVAVALVVLRQDWAGVIAPGLPPSTLTLAGEMLAVMGLAAPFYVHVSLASYLEISHGVYTLASVRPTLQSLGLIAGTALAFLREDPTLLAAGFTGAYVVMSGWAFIRIRHAGYARLRGERVTARETGEAFALFARTVLPILWLPIIVQGVWIVERAIASTLSSAAVAALDYARTITETVLVLISAPLGLMMLSTFAPLPATEVRRRLGRLGDGILLVGVPVSCLILVGGELLVRVLFGRGQFGEDSISVTSSILFGLSVGLWAQALSYAHVKALNAQRRNVAAALVVAIGAVSFVAAQYVMSRAVGVAGLGLGASAGALAQLVASSVATRQVTTVLRRLLLLFPIPALALPLWLWNGEALTTGLMAVAAMVAVVLAWLLGVPPLRRELCALIGRDP